MIMGASSTVELWSNLWRNGVCNAILSFFLLYISSSRLFRKSIPVSPDRTPTFLPFSCQHVVRFLGDNRGEEERKGKSAMRILLAEDNRRLSYELKMGLVDEGYAVDTAVGWVEGKELGECSPYGVLILCILMTRKEGVGGSRGVRRTHSKEPVSLVTPRDEV